MIIGIFTDILFLSIMYIMFLLTIFGIWGGKWLWKQLASSEKFKSGVPIYIKIVGCLAIVIFMVFIISGINLFYNGEASLIREIIQHGTMLMVYITFYDIGYILSIWKPIDDEQKVEQTKFIIKKRLSLIVSIFIAIYILISFFVILFITGEFLSQLFQHVVMGGVGFALGWIFWEHLKETRMLSGKFLKDLKLMSVIFEFPLVFLMVLGLFSVYSHSTLTLDKIILLGYILLFYLLAAYFIGLMLEVMKK